jgi:hypothetical protein
VLDICYRRHCQEAPAVLLSVGMSTLNYAFLIVHCNDFSNQSIGNAVLNVQASARSYVEAITQICDMGPVIPHHLTLTFQQILTDYIDAFNTWKEVDKKALARRTRLSLLSLYAHRHENIADAALSADFQTKIASMRGMMLKLEGEDNLTIFDACRQHKALSLIDDSEVHLGGYELWLPDNDELIFELLIDSNFAIRAPDAKHRRLVPALPALFVLGGRLTHLRQENWTRIGMRQPGGHRMFATCIFKAIKTLAVLVNDMKTSTFPPPKLVSFLNLEHQPQEGLTWADALAMAVDAAAILSTIPQADGTGWEDVHKQAMGLREKQAFFHVLGYLLEVALAMRLHRINAFVRSFARDIDAVGVRTLRSQEASPLIRTRAWLIDAIAAQDDSSILDKLAAPTNPSQHYHFTCIQTSAILALIASPHLLDKDTMPETLHIEWRHVRRCTVHFRSMARRMALIVTATHSPSLKTNEPLLDAVCTAIMAADVDTCCTARLVEDLATSVTDTQQQMQLRRAFTQCINANDTVYTLM